MDDVDKFFEALALDQAGLDRQLVSMSSFLSLVLAAIFGFLILMVYLKTSGKETRDRNLFMVIPVLTILMAVIMRMEGTQVILFFGIFGILSIVRFRSDLTDQKGITFILFSVIQGVLIGVNNYLLAVFAFIIVSLAIFIARYAFPHRLSFRLIFKVSGEAWKVRDLVESWLESKKIPFRYVNFSSDQGFSAKIQGWDTKTKLEYEISLQEEADLMIHWEEFLIVLKEQNVESEIKPGTSD